MTCIVGLEHNGGVTIGGDSMLSDFWAGASMVTPKVWKRGEFVYGYCGSLRAGQILRYIFAAPQLPDSDTDDALEEYLVNEWSETLRQTFLDAGNAKVKHEVQTTPNSWFLFGIRGRLYTMQSDFSVWRTTRGYASIGSGEQFALGALEVLKRSHSSIKHKIETALAAASEHAPTVGPPYYIVSTVDDDEDEAT